MAAQMIRADDCQSGLIRARLQMDPKAMRSFSLLLQRGVVIPFQAGTSISDLICEKIGVARDYLDERIQTIFLDGKAVDRPEAQIVRDGATLSLAAAMPGLAGATLRRGGHFVGFRSGITQSPDGAGSDCGGGRLYLKLFNLLINEMGPKVLAHGIVISRADLEGLLATSRDELLALCRKAQVGDSPMEPAAFFALDWLEPRQECELTISLG